MCFSDIHVCINTVVFTYIHFRAYFLCLLIHPHFFSGPSVRPECLNLTQSSLFLPLLVHHSPNLALGACLDTGHDRGYTQRHPHTVINTLSTPVLQVHQQASNNDLIPPEVRATRSRTAATTALLLDKSSNQKTSPDCLYNNEDLLIISGVKGGYKKVQNPGMINLTFSCYPKGKFFGILQSIVLERNSTCKI